MVRESHTVRNVIVRDVAMTHSQSTFQQQDAKKSINRRLSDLQKVPSRIGPLKYPVLRGIKNGR